MHLQMFPPKHLPRLRHDGLYNVRRWVYAFAIIIPNVMAALAFVHSTQGYIATGPLCSLPIRPFWYRLALSWVPRYLIMIYICYVAIRIYCHVGKEFRVFGQDDDESRSGDRTAPSSHLGAKLGIAMTAVPLFAKVNDEKLQSADKNDVPPDEDSVASRRPAVPTLHPAPKPKSRVRSPIAEVPEEAPSPETLASLPGSRRPSAVVWSGLSVFQEHSTGAVHNTQGSHQMAGPVAAADIANYQGPTPADHLSSSQTRNSVTTLGSSSALHLQEPESRALPLVASPQTGRGDLDGPNRAATTLVQDRRRAIQRQLRLLFIYPVAYILINIFPFTSHCLGYSDYYAQHPIFWVTILSFFCQSFRGFVDVAIFSWREKPWRHIPGSDGTLLGSFLFWRFSRTDNRAKIVPGSPRTPSTPRIFPSDEIEKPLSQNGLLGSLRRWSASLTSLSASSPRHSHPLSSPTTPTASPRARVVLHRRTYSGGSDRRRLALEQAAKRLAMERMQHPLNRLSLQPRPRESVVSSAPVSTRQGSHPGPIRREWWEDGQTDDLFRDDWDDAAAEKEKR